VHCLLARSRALEEWGLGVSWVVRGGVVWRAGATERDRPDHRDDQQQQSRNTEDGTAPVQNKPTISSSSICPCLRSVRVRSHVSGLRIFPDAQTYVCHTNAGEAGVSRSGGGCACAYLLYILLKAER
jgi:hypothetical protein